MPGGSHALWASLSTLAPADSKSSSAPACSMTMPTRLKQPERLLMQRLDFAFREDGVAPAPDVGWSHNLSPAGWVDDLGRTHPQPIIGCGKARASRNLRRPGDAAL